MGRAARKQLEIAGAEVPVIEAIDEMAGPYCSKLYGWRKDGDDLVRMKKQLMDRMEALGETLYVFRDGETKYKITLDTKAKLSVKREGEPDDDDDQSGDD